MPLIECLIEREGPTTINDGGFTFTFEENDAGHKVANVLSDGTADRLLSFKWFRLYNPAENYAEPDDDTGETAHEEGQGDTEPSTAEGDAEPDSEPSSSDPEDGAPETPAYLDGENEPEPGDTEPAEPAEPVDEETETQTILRLRGAGKSYREIAETVGKSKTYVSSVVNANK